jgi:xanthosine utilization system XapX-like protein
MRLQDIFNLVRKPLPPGSSLVLIVGGLLAAKIELQHRQLLGSSRFYRLFDKKRCSETHIAIDHGLTHDQTVRASNTK